MDHNNSSIESIEPGILYLKLSNSLKMFLMWALSIYFHISCVIEIVIACYYFYHSFNGILCSIIPTPQNLKRFQNLCVIGYIFNIITFIIIVIALNEQKSLNEEQMRLLYAGIIFLFICVNDYANYTILDMWVYITLQQNANQHPPPHMLDYENQIDLQSISEQNGPGNLFMMISTLFQIFFLITQLVWVFLYYDSYIYQLVLLVLVSYFFYHYAIGMRSSFSPTVKNLAKFIQSYKIIGILNLVSLTLILIVGMVQINKLSNLLEQELLYCIITYFVGLALIVFTMLCVYAIDMINYINSCFWIYIILQRRACQHPPPHLFDAENQFKSLENLITSRFEFQEKLKRRKDLQERLLTPTTTNF